MRPLCCWAASFGAAGATTTPAGLWGTSLRTPSASAATKNHQARGRRHETATPLTWLFISSSTNGDERDRLVTASPVMTKSRGPSWGRNNYPENGLVNPPRRDTRALSPAGMFGGKAPPRLAAQKSRPHAHLGPMRGAPASFLCKWGV